MTKLHHIIILASVLGVVLINTDVGAAWAGQACKEMPPVALDMKTLRETVIPHSFAFTVRLTPSGAKTVVWASDMAKAAGVQVGDEIRYQVAHGAARSIRTQVNDVINYVEYPQVEPKPGEAVEGLFWATDLDGSSDATIVLPRDIPMDVYLRHPDGTRTEVLV